jgi:hypothetical protein
LNRAGPTLVPNQKPNWLPAIAERIIIGSASQSGNEIVVLRDIPRIKMSESPGRNEPRMVAVSINKIAATPRTARVPRDSMSV